MAPIPLSSKGNSLNDLEKSQEQEHLLEKPTTPLRDAVNPLSGGRKAAVFTNLLVCVGLVVWLFFPSLDDAFGRSQPHSSSHYDSFSGNTLRSNGTHEYKRTVLMVSIDSLRAEYLDRGLTPNLLNISKQGLRAKSMRPIFPTLTFPNHWALMTGLYAESHGIIANKFWDPVLKETFLYNNIESAWKPEWWLGEPVWESAEKAGIRTANLMWPGPPTTMNNGTSTYFVGWRDHVPMSDKLDQIMEWIDMPLEHRPQLILAYEPSLDQAGHANGPNSPSVDESLKAVDAFAKDLHDALEARNLMDIVDIIFVSDHGMTDVSKPKLVFLDDILGEEGVDAIDHVDGWPAMGLRFHPDANVTQHLTALAAASEKNPEAFDVYTTETMPERYHFARNERIAPIWVVPKLGYVVTTREEGGAGVTKGTHGYDNLERSMQAMFVAHGPFSHQAKAQANRRSLLARARGCHRSGWHTASQESDTYIMETFQNVEVYNLVMKLLGAEKASAPNNGTVGFWDQYL